MQIHYYANTFKNVIIALTDMFNGLTVRRLDDSGVLSKEVAVPITFGPVNKYQYLRKRKEEGKEYYLQLPRMNLEMTGLSYAVDRVTGVNETRHFYDQALGLDGISDFYTDVNPTPYDLDFDLNVRTESLDDFSQILENILPYFNPALYLRVREFSFLTIERTLQVRLNSVSPEFIDPQEENEKREVNAKISMTVAAQLYRPISTSKIIKTIRSRYFVSSFTVVGDLSATSATNILAEQYSTSGIRDVSAAPSSASYDTSGTFQTIVDGTSASSYYFVSATSYSLSAGELP